ncbi:MAG TPA: acyltransferase [Bryobacteraceae bacterium]|nr:acyltransferase [Bryobacteraceae bacterium]
MFATKDLYGRVIGMTAGARVRQPRYGVETIECPADSAWGEPEIERPASVSTPDSRIIELDGLRGIAILLVLLTHFFSYSMMGRQWSGVAALAMKVTEPGWLGVDLFFVLSGFLITGILLNARGDCHYARNFYMRRALRILPLYLAVLLLMLVSYRGSGPAVLLGLAMSINVAPILHIAVPLGGAALWSLAVEEHFYLIWPWIVRAVRPATLGAVCISICLLEPAIRAAFRFQVDDVYFYSWFRFDGLAWGALIAVLVHLRRLRGETSGKKPLMMGALLIAVSLAAIALGLPHGILHRANRLGAAFQFALAEMALAGFVLMVVTNTGSRAGAILRFPLLLLFGDLSYCLYITHEMVAGLIDKIASHFVDLNAQMSRFSFISIRAALAIALCLGIAILSRNFFERPILALKRYFKPAG